MKYCDYKFENEEQKRAFVLECEKKFKAQLDAAADKAAAKKNLKFITLAGPSCSGKTTTAGILIKRLEDVGKRVRVISIDDFFYDRHRLEKEAQRLGQPFDMDSVAALDLGDLKDFISGMRTLKPALLPKFDFATGSRVSQEALVPHENDVFIFEGIQAVYPEVVELFDPDTLLRIYISVAEGIETESGMWLPREIRLLRRLLRDSQFRNTSAETTFENWGGVVRNEKNNIEPYTENCDITVNSGMEYEICVMRDPILKLLSEMNEGDDHYILARMLTEKLQRYPSISSKYVPENSVMREFLGTKDLTEGNNK